MIFSGKGGENIGYNGYTEKRKASNEKYLKNFINQTFRITAEEKKIIEEKAKAEGKSVNQYLKDRALAD